MKKLFFIVASFAMLASFTAIPTQSKAQIVTTLAPTAAKDTMTNTDTAYVYISSGVGSNSSAIIESDAVSVRAKVRILTGSVSSGTVSFEGNTVTGDWKQISAGTITNTNSQNVFDYNLRNSTGDLQYTQYRLVFYTVGTVSAEPKAYFLRRQTARLR